MLKHAELRQRLRSFLSEADCLIPAAVFDPLSARIAEEVGYQIGLLAGSVASNVILAAPDVMILTLTELADQIRRIMRVSNLSLIVDADHGYGNALNVMRTIQELEHAGVAGVCIEDAALPGKHGQAGQAEVERISSMEMVGKLRAAVEARKDRSLVLIARVSSKGMPMKELVERVHGYASCGIDAIWAAGVGSLEEIEAIQTAAKLPMIVGTSLALADTKDLAARGVRIRLPCHQSVVLRAAIKSLQDTYAHLHSGGSVADLVSRVATQRTIDHLVDGDRYRAYSQEYMQDPDRRGRAESE
jgi:carboxyvinyl-carboxyphosphonate phosphorylmutase